MTESNPYIGKFEVRDPVVEGLMTELASRIQSQLPGSFRFSLFLYQEVDDEVSGKKDEANIFYCSTLHTSEALPLIETWCRKQLQ